MEVTKSSIKKERTELENGTALPVVERFFSIQGEGHHTGSPVHFIRLGGCDVGCPWCDTKESWEAEAHPIRSIEELVDEVVEEKGRTVVLTGGEPTVHQLGPLTRKLHQAGVAVHLETSGAYPLTGRFDWICLSPKRFSPPQEEVYPMADELKVVVHDERDLEWAEQERRKVRTDCKLFLQPQWGRAERSSEMILSYIKGDPSWRISLQTHKYLDLP